MVFVRIIGLSLLTFFCFAMGTIPSNQTNGIAKLFGPLFFIAAPALYFLPIYEAFKRDKKNIVSIALVNTFLGWSLIGWIVALIWAIKESELTQVVINQPVRTPEPVVISNSSAQKTCPFCAESIMAAAMICRYCQRDQPVIEVQTREVPQVAAKAGKAIEHLAKDEIMARYGIQFDGTFYSYGGLSYRNFDDVKASL